MNSVLVRSSKPSIDIDTNSPSVTRFFSVPVVAS
jgi:hypothetical protein